MKNVNFVETENSVKMSFELLIPKKSGKPAGSDFDLDKARQRGISLMIDIIGAFSQRIIASLERRMQACQRNLLNHLEDIEYNDGMHICWRRKNGTGGEFNIPSFQAMQDCVEALKNSNFKMFCTERSWIDQTLKALLNDTEQDHSDAGGFCYSQLVSLLCELQVCPLS